MCAPRAAGSRLAARGRGVHAGDVSITFHPFRSRRARIAVLTGLLCAAVAAFVLHPGDPRDRYPVWGVDVSHHQKPVDWARVRAAGAVFAYAKVSEGRDHVDTRFREHLAGARAAGLHTGAYHYFTLCSPGREQAEHFVRTLGDIPCDLPPVIDLEFAGNCSARPGREELLRELDAFIAVVEARAGRRPILYTTKDFAADYGLFERAADRIWIRAVHTRPSFLGTSRWTLWQFRVAPLDGVEGPVDHNVFRGTEKELLDLR